MHTALKEDGPTGYNNGSLIKLLNEHEKFESYKIVYDNNTVGAYTVALESNNEYRDLCSAISKWKSLV